MTLECLKFSFTIKCLKFNFTIFTKAAIVSQRTGAIKRPYTAITGATIQTRVWFTQVYICNKCRGKTNEDRENTFQNDSVFLLSLINNSKRPKTESFIKKGLLIVETLHIIIIIQ